MPHWMPPRHASRSHPQAPSVRKGRESLTPPRPSFILPALPASDRLPNDGETRAPRTTPRRAVVRAHAATADHHTDHVTDSRTAPLAATAPDTAITVTSPPSTTHLRRDIDWERNGARRNRGDARSVAYGCRGLRRLRGGRCDRWLRRRLRSRRLHSRLPQVHRSLGDLLSRSACARRRNRTIHLLQLRDDLHPLVTGCTPHQLRLGRGRGQVPLEVVGQRGRPGRPPIAGRGDEDER